MPGTGKSHLGLALAIQAVKTNRRVRFCHNRKNVIPSVRCWLPDSQSLPRCRGFSHQLELEDAVVVCGLARRLVQLHR